VETTSLPGNRLDALHAGIRIEVVTIVWMMLEALVAIGSGAIAGSILLIAFGADSVIELISGVVLLWRLASETTTGDMEWIESVERRATWISAILLVLLCLYVAITIMTGLVWRAEPEGSSIGILISMGALVFMPLLARAKRGINQQLDSAALRADIAESITCAFMAGTVLVGLVLNAALGWWWAEYVAAVVLLYWLIGEMREAFEAARGNEEE
jgi:divalent metal cation (Fe/Co/Zn/Cd) transporter